MILSIEQGWIAVVCNHSMGFSCCLLLVLFVYCLVCLLRGWLSWQTGLFGFWCGMCGRSHTRRTWGTQLSLDSEEGFLTNIF